MVLVMQVFSLEEFLECSGWVLNLFFRVFIFHRPLAQEALLEHFTRKQIFNSVHVVQVLIVFSFTDLIIVYGHRDFDIKTFPACHSINSNTSRALLHNQVGDGLTLTILLFFYSKVNIAIGVSNHLFMFQNGKLCDLLVQIQTNWIFFWDHWLISKIWIYFETELNFFVKNFRVSVFAVTRLFVAFDGVAKRRIFTFNASIHVLLRHFLPPVIFDGVPGAVEDSAGALTDIIFAVLSFISAFIALLNVHSEFLRLFTVAFFPCPRHWIVTKSASSTSNFLLDFLLDHILLRL